MNPPLPPLRRAMALIALIALAGAAAAAELVIVHPGLAATEVDADTLKAIFLGKKRSLPDGTRVEPVVLAAGDVHERFLRERVQTTAAQFQNHWKRLVFIGQGRMPTTLDTSAAVVAHVATHPGSIGYIDAATPHDGVKVVTVR